MDWQEVHSDNIGRFATVIDHHKGKVFPDTYPFGVPDCPSRDEQAFYRRIHHWENNFEFTHTDHVVTLSIGCFAKSVFIIREDKQRFFDENRLFVAPRRSGLFYAGHEIDYIPSDEKDRAKLFGLLVRDQCTAWERLHVEYEERFNAWRAKEIERRARAWEDLNRRIRDEQELIALGIRIH